MHTIYSSPLASGLEGSNNLLLLQGPADRVGQRATEHYRQAVGDRLDITELPKRRAFRGKISLLADNAGRMPSAFLYRPVLGEQPPLGRRAAPSRAQH
jgi:hypothetical protein